MHFDHDFDWKGVRILDVKRNYNKRLISEMLYIRIQKNSINLQTDIDGLDHAYIATLNNL